MTARQINPLQGYKGGSPTARTPVEAPDSLVSTQQARIVDLLSEGEIGGLVNGISSMFLDEAPASTYPSLQWDYRLGTQDQSHMPGFAAVESESAVGVAVTNALPYTRAVTNVLVSALRVNFSLGRFARQDSSNGDTKGARVEFEIDVASGFNDFVLAYRSAFDGKTASGYTRSVRVDLPRPAPINGWRVRVRRVTGDNNSSTISDVVTIASVTEIVDYKFKYPNSALIALSFDAEAFGGAIPKRSYHIKGRILRVPANYDPATRTYSGAWDGTFRLAWSNNPAWVYYDLLLNERFGLGDRISASQIDKWGLYQIAQYCDQLVDDGKGGKEPRFTCNLYLQKQADALKVMQDLAAVFRGITYWGLGQAMVSADMPSDPVYTYTNANVINGRFDRKGSKKSTIYTAILSGWTDPNDFHRIKYEYVQASDALIAKFGIRSVTLSNIGCSSQGQAHRAAQWALLSNQYDTNTVTFTVGLEGIRALPGQVVRIADQHRQGRRVGGRVRSGSTASKLLLDVLPNIGIEAGDTISINLPSGVSEDRLVRSFSTADGSITPTVPFSAAPVKGGVWAYESEELKTELYRIVSISEGTTPLEYTITALTYTAGKHSAVDFGTIISTRPTTAVPIADIDPPQNLKMGTSYKLEQGQAVSVLTISWDAVPKAAKYDIEWQRDNSGWVYAGRVATTEIDVVGVYSGIYRVRARSMNVANVLSAWVEIGPEFLSGKTTPPPVPVNVRTTSELFSVRLDWGFPTGAEDTSYSQIQIALTPSGENPNEAGQLAYPTSTYTHIGMGAGQLLFFRVRLIDKSGNVGGWSDWVDGRASLDAEPVLDLLLDQLTKDQFGQDLKAEIDGKATQEYVNDQIADAVENIDDLVDALVYVPTDAYLRYNTVRVGENLWSAIKDVPAAADGSNGPPNPAYWVNAGQVSEQTNALAAVVQQNTTDINTVEDLQTVQAQTLSGLRVDVDKKASITSVNTLSGTVTTQGDKIAANTTAIVSINAKINDPVTGLTAIAGGINSLSGTVDLQGQAITAQAQKIDGVFAQVNPAMAGETTSFAGSNQAYVGVYSIQSAVIEGDYAQGKRTDTILVQLNTQTAAIEVAQSVSVRAQNTADAATDIAIGANGLASTANSKANSVQNQVDISYQVKLQANNAGDYTWAGFGLGLSNASGVFQSRFVIAADQFIIATTQGADYAQSPFAVVGTQTFIKDAFISKLAVVNGIVGSTLYSATNTSYGQPRMTIDFNIGQQINRHPTKNNTYKTSDSSADQWVIDGVLRVRIGSW